MAKRKAEEEEPSTTPDTETRSSARTAARATRSVIRRGDASLTPPVDNPQPRRTKKARLDGASPSAAAGTPSSASPGASALTDRKTRSATRSGDVVLALPVDNPQPRKTKKASLVGASPSPVAGASSSAASAGTPNSAALADGETGSPTRRGDFTLTVVLPFDNPQPGLKSASPSHVAGASPSAAAGMPSSASPGASGSAALTNRKTRSATRSGDVVLALPVDNPQPRKTKKASLVGASPSPVAGASSSAASARTPSSAALADGETGSPTRRGDFTLTVVLPFDNPQPGLKCATPSPVAGASPSAAAGTPSSAPLADGKTPSSGGRGDVVLALELPVDNPQPLKTEKASLEGASPSSVAGASPSAAAGTPSSAALSNRKTRSATRRGEVVLALPVDNPQPRKTKKASLQGASPSPVAGMSLSAAASPFSSAAAALAFTGQSSYGDRKTVIIEHCLQAEAFKMKAEQVKEGLEKSIVGVRVLLNPGTPRKGCFEIRMENGSQIFESLLDVKEPFDAVKALDVKKVVSDIVLKI